MRKRKNEDKSVLVYKFHVEPVGDIPERFWQIARSMQNLWNRLVDMRQAVFDSFDDNTTVADKNVAWQKLNSDVLTLVRSDEIKAELNWECRENIYDRFRVASTKVTKEIKEWRKRKNDDAGKPIPTLKKRFALDKVLIPHRYTGGGKALTEVFKYPSRSKTFGARLPAEDAYEAQSADHKRRRMVSGTFGLGDIDLPFRANLHRQLPTDAMVKNLSWSGKFLRGVGWQWFLLLTVEQEPIKLPRGNSELIAGIDFGWRRLRDDRLRIGVIVDTNANFYEIQLPLGVDKNIDNYVTCEINFQKEADALKDQMKAELIAAGYAASVVQKYGFTALNKLRRELQQSADETLMPVRQKLDQWHEQNIRLLGANNRLRQHFQKRHKWLYENIANELCQHYKVIVWEKNLNLQKLSETVVHDGNHYAIEGGKRYKRAAAIYQFRDILKRTAAKYGVEIVGAETTYRTTTCYLCGVAVESGAKLMLECVNGHIFDQDINAAHNLLRQVVELSDQRQQPITNWLAKLPAFWRVIKSI